MRTDDFSHVLRRKADGSSLVVEWQRDNPWHSRWSLRLDGPDGGRGDEVRRFCSYTEAREWCLRNEPPRKAGA